MLPPPKLAPSFGEQQHLHITQARTRSVMAHCFKIISKIYIQVENEGMKFQIFEMKIFFLAIIIKGHDIFRHNLF